MFDDFTADELDYVRSLIRIELRSVEAKLRDGERKWGDQYRNREKNEAQVAKLESMYRKLGKDPDDITVMEDVPAR